MQREGFVFHICNLKDQGDEVL